MYQEIKEDLSVYFWLKDKFQAYPIVTIVDAYPDAENLTLPTISVEAEDVTSYELELGNRKEVKVRKYVFDIFALTKQQKDEFAYKIFNDLDDPIPVYDYDQGFPPNVSPTKLGSLIRRQRNIRYVRVYSELVEKMLYRAIVILIAEFDSM